MTDELKIEDIVAKVTEALLPKLNENINAAITGHTKRLQKDIDAKLETVKAPVVEQPKTEIDPKKLSPETAALHAKVEELTRSFEEAKKQAEQAQLAQRDERAFNSLKAKLQAQSLSPEMAEIAAERLFKVQGRVSFDDQGQPLFKMKRSPVPGLPEEEVELPLESGVEHWLKSKEAAPFLPAPASKVGDGRGGRSPLGIPSGRGPNGMPKYDKPASTDDEKVARAMERERVIAEAARKSGF